ncbi:MAG TPA: HDIG domain-containing protein [Pyrinomonadaceae bacterium]|nr:HDIG domain-containing protein [Pyrinomonadaceae bacterium]
MSRSSRRLRFASPFAAARNTALRYILRPLKWLTPTTRFVLGFALLVVVTTLLLAKTHSRPLAEEYRIGEVVRRTVVAPADIGGVNITETEERRAAAREAAHPVFIYDPTRAESAVQSFRAAWEDLEQRAKTHGTNKRELTWPGVGSEAVARAIIAHNFNVQDLDRLLRLLRETADKYIYEDGEEAHFKDQIVLVDARNASVQTLLTMPQSRMTSLSAARESLRSGLAQLRGWTPEQQTALASAMLPLVAPNVIFDETATQNVRAEAAQKVEPVAISLKRNQVLAREGDTVTEPMIAQFAALRAYGSKGRPWHNLIGLLFIVAGLYWVVWEYTEHRSATISLSLSKKKAFALVGVSIVVQTVLMRVGFTVADSIATQSMRAPFNDSTIWNFAIPFAAAALLVALLVDTQLALITGLITALFAGLLAPSGVPKVYYAVISSAAAIYGIGRYRERQSVTVAGLIVALVNALMAVVLITYAQQPLTLNTVLLAIGCGIIGGLLTTIFTAGGLPINESMFDILTDVKLLELSNADLPVLGQLALRAPGTNQHSHAVGQLAEDACRAIGANPLLARIGALYHDIGKLAAPDYFVENQQGDNPHDRLRPSQSARIITSHVTYGLKLAKEIGLPKQISDFIPQHHGTRTLHFFLRKAQAQAAPGEEVDEMEFRYPGPKPQFKESAIMMIADSCEAAARSLARPDPENIRAIVAKIIDAIVSDGQLDESNLTLRELTTIREAITTALTAIYHGRIDYPGFNPPSPTGALPPLPQAELDTEERGVSYSKPSEIPINKGGEVEDEAVTRKAAKR